MFLKNNLFVHLGSCHPWHSMLRQCYLAHVSLGEIYGVLAMWLMSNWPSGMTDNCHAVKWVWFSQAHTYIGKKKFFFLTGHSFPLECSLSELDGHLLWALPGKLWSQSLQRFWSLFLHPRLVLCFGDLFWVLWHQWRSVHSSRRGDLRWGHHVLCLWAGLILAGSIPCSAAEASGFIGSPSIPGPHVMISLRFWLLRNWETTWGSLSFMISAYRKTSSCWHAWAPSLRLPRQPRQRPLFWSPQRPPLRWPPAARTVLAHRIPVQSQASAQDWLTCLFYRFSHLSPSVLI